MAMTMLSDPFIVRNLTFGIEDSLVSTTGVLVGIAAAKFKQRDILVAGFILILVEALSMSFGAFLSDENFLKTAKEKYNVQQVVLYSVTMFSSYFLIGLLLLLPYAFKVRYASAWVIAIAMILLIALIMTFEKNLRKAFLISSIGGVLMTISILIGGQL